MAKCFQSSCTDEQDSLDNIWIAGNSKPSKPHGQCNNGSVNPHCFNYFIKNAFFFFFSSCSPTLQKQDQAVTMCYSDPANRHLHEQQSSASPLVPLKSMGLFVPRSIEGLQGHIRIVRDRVTEERLFLTVLQHDFHLLSLLLLTISRALLEISHLAEALMAFQALELAVHMSPLYVTVHTYGCRYTFWLFSFVCVTRLTQPSWGF